MPISTTYIFHTMTPTSLTKLIEYLPTFKVIVCRFCQVCIPPNAPLRHYRDNHRTNQEHPINTLVRDQIIEYMTTIDLCRPDQVISPQQSIPQLKQPKKGFICKWAGCEVCRTSESGMRTHYYAHIQHIPKEFKNWDITWVQTFFEGHYRRYNGTLKHH
jgi:hypothetical protein